MSGVAGSSVVATSACEFQMIVYRSSNIDRRYVLVYDVAPLQSFDPTVQQTVCSFHGSNGPSGVTGGNGPSGVTGEASHSSDQEDHHTVTVDQPDHTVPVADQRPPRVDVADQRLPRVDVRSAGRRGIAAWYRGRADRPTSVVRRSGTGLRHSRGGAPRRQFQTYAASSNFYLNRIVDNLRNAPISMTRRRVQQPLFAAVMLMYRASFDD